MVKHSYAGIKSADVLGMLGSRFICRFTHPLHQLSSLFTVRALTVTSEKVTLVDTSERGQRHFSAMSFVEEKEKFLSMPMEERRKLYRCKEGYNTLQDIPDWAAYLTENRDRLNAQFEDWQRTGSLPSLQPGRKAVLKGGKKTGKISKTQPITVYLPKVDDSNKAGIKKREIIPSIATKVSLWKGDITTLEIDAIVNAANSSLRGGGGVDGAIHRAAGPALLEECKSLKGCPTGEAKVTGGYMLPAKYVIHTVGPRGENREALKSCYERCLSLMIENKLRSIAFPCISTGIYGYPQEAAAKVTLEITRSFLEKNADSVDRIIFCVFLPSDVTIYENFMQLYFPID